jgi:hypothetical protein
MGFILISYGVWLSGEGFYWRVRECGHSKKLASWKSFMKSQVIHERACVLIAETAIFIGLRKVPPPPVPLRWPRPSSIAIPAAILALLSLNEHKFYRADPWPATWIGKYLRSPQMTMPTD